MGDRLRRLAADSLSRLATDSLRRLAADSLRRLAADDCHKVLLLEGNVVKRMKICSNKIVVMLYICYKSNFV